jgi:polysaccharide biosynthesis transport protein
VTESLADPVVSDLRTKYLDASKRMSDLERKLGPTHIVLANLKNTMDELSILLFQELGRVAQTYQSDYEVAVAREKVLAGNLTRQHSIAVTANDALVKLRQLEQKAESVGTLYETYLQRYLEAAQQESFPMADAHIIGQANKPPSPSQPRKPFVLAISLVLGAVVGVGLGRLRESMDRGFRTVEQLRGELGTDVLGILPNLLPGSLPQLAKRKVADLRPNFIPDAIAPIMRYAIDHPFSRFAETLRAAKVAADLALRDRSPKIIGLVSFLPNEGKSTVAKNFTSLLALQSAKIDADARNPGLSRAIGSERAQDSNGGPYVPPTLAEFVKYEPDSGLQILPCIYAENDPHVAEGFSPATLHGLLQSTDQSFDYIVIDLPPIGPVVNARGIASAIDAFIFIVAWGTASRGAIRAVLSTEQSIRDKLLGVVLNKVDTKKLKIYEHFGSDGYYYQQFENYYKCTKPRPPASPPPAQLRGIEPLTSAVERRVVPSNGAKPPRRRMRRGERCVSKDPQRPSVDLGTLCVAMNWRLTYLVRLWRRWLMPR